ncbi:EamA family transporter [Desulfobacula sp.]|uniref:EamA family transporter n=1 Tax=Desulfobacula sp. TaxID=2593537 RepID=UPI00260E24B5|nr:EamA family transporter [Desulfobacula sp.]
MAELLAILASFFYALNMVVARVGLKDTDTFSAGILSMCFSLMGAIVAFVFVMPIHSISARAVFFFAMAGFSGPCLGRLLLYLGIKRVGSAIASSLYSVKPLFAALAAVVLLGEKVTAGIGIGILIMIIGLSIISSSNSDASPGKRWSKKDMIFPILAGLGYGFSHVFRKLGLNLNAEPLLGLLVQNIAALFFPLIVIFWQTNNNANRAWSSLRGWIIFGLAGICSTLGQICLFMALSKGDVVIVAPLSTISPLFVLLMAGLFLKGMDHISWKIGMGCFFILAATVLLTLYKN